MKRTKPKIVWADGSEKRPRRRKPSKRFGVPVYDQGIDKKKGRDGAAVASNIKKIEFDNPHFRHGALKSLPVAIGPCTLGQHSPEHFVPGSLFFATCSLHVIIDEGRYPIAVVGPRHWAHDPVAAAGDVIVFMRTIEVEERLAESDRDERSKHWTAFSREAVARRLVTRRYQFLIGTGVYIINDLSSLQGGT